MKAWTFNTAGEFREVLELTETALPAPRENELLIDIKARPVNPADLMFISGKYRRKPNFPQIAGLDGAGVIVSCGPGIKSFQPGDHVVFRQPGTWAEQIVLDKKLVVKIPDEIPFEQACQLPLNGLTASALILESRAAKGDFILLDAAGSFVARLIVQMAVQRGIRILGIVRDANTAEAILQSGADAVYDQNDPLLVEKVLALTGEKKISCFLDAVGGDILSTVIPLIAPFGRVILYGNLSSGQPATFTNASIIYSNLTVRGFGIDHWLSVVSAEKLRSVYDELFHALSSGSLIFPKTESVELNKVPFINRSNKTVIIS